MSLLSKPPLQTEVVLKSSSSLKTAGSAVPAHLSRSAEDMRREAKQINTVEDFINFFSSDFDGFIVCLALALGMLGASILLTRVLRPYRAKFPIVLAYLFVGISVRLVQTDLAAEELMIISKPFIRVSLTAVGLIIGSHLNRVTLAPLLVPMCRFIPIFSIVVIVVVSGVGALLFPALAHYAPLVGAIALERSSPEALAGIVSAKSDGMFTSTTMCTAAIQDVLALVFYVVFSSTVGTPFSVAAFHLVELTCGTALAMSITVLAVRAIEIGFIQRGIARLIGLLSSTTAVGNKHGGRNHSQKELHTGITPTSSSGTILRSPTNHHLKAGGEPPALTISPAAAPDLDAPDPADIAAYNLVNKFISNNRHVAKASLTTLLVIIPLVGWFFHVELLLAAVLAGVILNYDSKHHITPLLEESESLINMVLFTFLGQRIMLMSYLNNLIGAFIFFAARTFALAIGSWFAGHVARLPPHSPDTQWMHKYRWMGLITQLAIALSLVDRMEEQFKDSIPMASAFGGSVLLALITGPPALQYVLSKVGEAGMAKEGGDSHA